jgi:hypothetical protein
VISQACVAIAMTALMPGAAQADPDANKKLVEHWDVTQEEGPVSETKSGNPVFEPGK